MGQAYGGAYSISETFVLIEIDVDPSRKASDIAKILCLDKSTVSRVLSSLQRKGLITIERDQHDKRRQRFSLTPKGREYLVLNDEENAGQLADFTSQVNPEELTEIQVFLRDFADGLGQPPALLRKEDNPLLGEIRRLSRAFDILGSSYAGTDFNSTQINILARIAHWPQPLRAKDIATRFDIPANTMSSNISHFKALGLIAQKQDEQDGRNLYLFLTPKGKKVFKSAQKKVEDFIAGGTRKCSKQRIKNFITYFAKYVRAKDSPITRSIMGSEVAPGPVVLRSALTVSEICSSQERKVARAFLMYHLVRLGRTLQAPEVLAGKDSIIFQLLDDSTLAGICEFRFKREDLHLSNFAVAGNFDQSPIESSFLERACELALSQEERKKLRLDKSHYAAGALTNSSLSYTCSGRSIVIDRSCF